jgi:hypothetical protein
VPQLLNDVRRMMLAVQPQQAESAAALLQELVDASCSALSCADLRGALVQLQQLPVGITVEDISSELENEAAALLLQAWQDVCSAAVASGWSDCTGAA